MAIGDDFSISVTGDIRYTGSGSNYTVIAFHRWLGDLMDDAAASGNDILDITDATASERSTDNIITLNSPYNIDDEASKHLYDGSIIQASGATIYDGILVFANAGAYLTIIQNGKIVTPNFWTTGLNADSANGISHRFMLKTRTGGSDIDGRRIVGQTREFGFTYSEFKINGTSRGNNVLALTYASDLNNQTSEATVEGWAEITNTEGYRVLDVDNNGSSEAYYSEWNRDAFTINQLFERAKWLTKRALSESACAETGSDFIIGNGTITGQAQSFTVGENPVLATRVLCRLKKVGTGGSGNITATIRAHGGGQFAEVEEEAPVEVVAVNVSRAGGGGGGSSGSGVFAAPYFAAPKVLLQFGEENEAGVGVGSLDELVRELRGLRVDLGRKKHKIEQLEAYVEELEGRGVDTGLEGVELWEAFLPTKQVAQAAVAPVTPVVQIMQPATSTAPVVVYRNSTLGKIAIVVLCGIAIWWLLKYLVVVAQVV